MFAGASGLPQLSVSINSTTGDLVERAKFLQRIIEGLELILRGLLLFKITHHQDAQISRVLAFDMRALELQRPTLPDAASSINGKVVTDIVPSPSKMSFSNGAETIYRFREGVPPCPVHRIVMHRDSIGGNRGHGSIFRGRASIKPIQTITGAWSGLGPGLPEDQGPIQEIRP